MCGHVHRYTTEKWTSVRHWVCAPVHYVMCVGMCTGYTTEKWTTSVMPCGILAAVDDDLEDGPEPSSSGANQSGGLEQVKVARQLPRLLARSSPRSAARVYRPSSASSSSYSAAARSPIIVAAAAKRRTHDDAEADADLRTPLTPMTQRRLCRNDADDASAARVDASTTTDGEMVDKPSVQNVSMINRTSTEWRD